MVNKSMSIGEVLTIIGYNITVLIKDTYHAFELAQMVWSHS